MTGRSLDGVGYCSYQGFVVSEECELSALYVVAELLDAQVGSQQLSVKGRVLPLGVGELLAEEGEWMPGPVVELVQGASHGNVRSIARDGQLAARCRVFQEGGIRKCLLCLVE